MNVLGKHHFLSLMKIQELTQGTDSQEKEQITYTQKLSFLSRNSQEL